MPRARDLRRKVTEAEKRLWQRLRQPPFKEKHFRRQATIGSYFCDFGSHQCRLAIEIDGGQHVDNADDRRRTADLEQRGYRVLWFWNNEVIENVEGVLTIILGAIQQPRSPPPPTPPRHSLRSRGEGSRMSLRHGDIEPSQAAQTEKKDA